MIALFPIELNGNKSNPSLKNLNINWDNFS